MNLKQTIFTAALFASAAFCGDISAQEKIALPEPAITGGMPLNEAIAKRRTERDFTPGKLDMQTISDLLYAAWGVSSPDGKRTIPTALNRQDLVIYLLTPEKAYRYSDDGKSLVVCAEKDLRKYATKRPGMGEAGSISIVICGDKGKWKNMPGAEKYMYTHAGAVMQNLYLACTSRGLATVICGSFDGPPLKKELQLPADQEILLVQIIGTKKK